VDDDCGNDNVILREADVAISIEFFVNASTRFLWIYDWIYQRIITERVV
jgi:hypothetical protein